MKKSDVFKYFFQYDDNLYKINIVLLILKNHPKADLRVFRM